MKSFNSGATLLAILLALVLTVAGCSTLSENSPVDPGQTGSTATTSTDAYAEAFIRSDTGGTLTLGNNRIYFPPRSLREDTLVSIVREGGNTVFDLAPDGIEFKRPVLLTLEMAPVGGFGVRRPFSFPAIYYFNEVTSEWENIGGVPDYSERVISTTIEHFSRYGTVSPYFH